MKAKELIFGLSIAILIFLIFIYGISIFYSRGSQSRDVYSFSIFFISFLFSVLFISIGAFIIKSDFIGAGLMGSGLLILLYGIVPYWRDSDNIPKFIVSIIWLFVFIFLAYSFTKFKKRHTIS